MHSGACDVVTVVCDTVVVEVAVMLVCDVLVRVVPPGYRQHGVNTEAVYKSTRTRPLVNELCDQR